MMKHKMIKSIALSITLCVPLSARAGIPTIDPGAIAALISKNIADITHYAKVIADARKRYDELKSHTTKLDRAFNALNGERSIGDLLHDPALRAVLPDNLERHYDDAGDLFDQVQGGGVVALNPTAGRIYEDLNLRFACDEMPIIASINNCKRTAIKQARDKGMLVDSMAKMQERIDNIDEIMKEINGVREAKEMEALQARIGVEQASLQAESMRMSMMFKAMDVQDRLNDQAKASTQQVLFNEGGAIVPKPFTW